MQYRKRFGGVSINPTNSSRRSRLGEEEFIKKMKEKMPVGIIRS